MEPVAAPDSLDLQDFQFKLHRRVQIFNPSIPITSEPLDVIATASKYGLLFLGAPDKTLRVLQTKQLVESSGTQCPQRTIQLPSVPVHVSLNCDCELLSVVVYKESAPVVIVYNTKSLVTENVTVFKEIRLSATPNVQLCRLLWNPCQADSMAVCMSDGALSVFQCKPTSLELQNKSTNARCLSWSPKGKQIITGNADGTLNQYKPDLTLVKTIPAAKVFNNTAVLSIHWLSNYQFCVVYGDSTNPESRPCVSIVNTPKAGTCSYINYDDICYSMGDSRTNQYFLLHLPLWGVILSSSANSMEVGVLGTLDQNNWQQWIQVDEARAELPLMDKQESYPIGISLDNSALIQLPWGDGQILPHMPMLHILTHTGILVSFFAINLTQNAQPLCITPEAINIQQHLFALDNTQSAPLQNNTPPAQIPSNVQDFSFNIAQNTITSTPTIPKSSNITANKPISTNLFANVVEEPKPKENPPEPSYKTPQIQSITNMFSKFDSLNNGATSSDFKNTMQSQQKAQEIQTQNVVKQTSENANKTLQNKSTELTYESIIKSVPNEVIKSMLLSEVNSFQHELFELLQRCRGVNIEVGDGDEMNKIATILSSNKISSQINWSDDDMKKQMTILKHDLINTCAFLAEARMQPATMELEQLAQLDPVSANKMTCIKLTSYYIESQLQQVNSVLDEQWENFQNTCRQKTLALDGINNTDYMKMPTLEKIYQPLLKQSEILVKQQNIIASLQNTMDGMDLASIPRKNPSSSTNTQSDNDSKNKTLSWLAKSLNDMNIQSKNVNKTFVSKKSNAKYDALRNALSNRRTVKIKPVKMDPPNLLQSFHDWNSTIKPDTKVAKSDSTIKNTNVAPNVSIVPQVVSKPLIVNNQSNIVSTPPKNNALQNLNDFVSKTTNQSNNMNVKLINPSPTTATATADKLKEYFAAKPTPTAGFQNVFGQNIFADKKSVAEPKINIFVPPSTAASPTSTIPIAVSTFKPSPVSNPPPLPIIQPSIPVSAAPSIFGAVSQPQSNIKKPLEQVEKKDIPTSTPLIKETPKPQTEAIFKLPVSTSIFAPSTTAPIQLKNFSFSFTSPTATTSLNTSISPVKAVQSPNQAVVNTEQPKSSLIQLLTKDIATTTAPVQVFNKPVVGSSSIFAPNPQLNLNFTPNSVATNSFGAVTNTAPSIFGSTAQTVPNAAVVKDEPTKSIQINPNIFNAKSISLPTTSTTPVITTSVSSETVAKSGNVAPAPIEKSSEPSRVPNMFGATPITSPAVKPFDKGVTEVAFGAIKTSETPNVVVSVALPIASLSFGTTTASSIFPSTSVPSLITNTSTAATTTATALFSSPQPSVSTTAPFANSNAPTNMFGSPTVSTSPTSSSMFGSPAPVNTCASSLFGAANAAIDTSVASMFGSTSISTSNAQSPFGTANKPAGSIFGGGSSVFGGQTTFSSSGTSIFSGNSTSTIGQPQNNSVFGGTATFGGGATFGGFGNTQQPANIFGQAVQPTNTFGNANNANQSSIFGGSPIAKSTFGSPAPAPQQSLFGTPSAPNSQVFGGSPAFGSKPVFGQTTSFGSPPSGSFGGMFGSNDQGSVAQTGFGTTSGFNKPSGGFGGSPKFGGSPSFGSSPTFGSTPGFGGPVANNSFGASPGFGGGTQQSSTFENLASQSTISFGNLAQQTQQPQQQSAPAFQGSSSFSTWR
ncbi:nuclear pore complex protein Nup214 [Arctopsyche grandis]|uniref:nuclear pore complex protein Nup214 n=1 Tax=Arctopsyche grandis TaxID=121162 RepID=UPI00406D6EC2